MLGQERQAKIIQMLQEQRIVKISQIVRDFEVSNETARRDLAAIQEMGIAKRIYGGAVLQDANDHTYKVSSVKPQPHGDADLNAVAKKAASLIKDGESIAMGPGTTVLEIAKHIKYRKDLTVITNSIHILTELMYADVNLYMLGGQLNHDELDLAGSLTTENLDKFFVDKAFIGAGGVSFECGISEYSTEEASLKKQYCEHAGKVYLVSGSSKFGVNALSISMPLKGVDAIVTDTGLPRDYAARIQEMGIELILVDPANP